MRRYRITFNSCMKGAIGIRYTISAIRSAESPEKALLSLYDDYDHIHQPRIEEIHDDH